MVFLEIHGYAFLVSILVILGIIGITVKILHKGIRRSFVEIIKDREGFPSLSLFQFFLWTTVISFGFLSIYLSIYLIRIMNGVYSPPLEEIPTGILALMGISTAVPIARSKMVSAHLTESKNVHKLSSILQDKEGRPTLAKFQMFIWTWIAIIIYLVILFSSVSEIGEPDYEVENIECKDNKYSCLAFPDIDPSLVVLMGLSQTAYLGREYYNRNKEIASQE